MHKDKQPSLADILAGAAGKQTRVVALRSLAHPEVIAKGRSGESVLRRARKISGKKHIPTLVHVPQPGRTYIY